MSTLAAPELDALVHREHSNPHAVLGAHPADGGVVVRALRPSARSVHVRTCTPRGAARAAGAARAGAGAAGAGAAGAAGAAAAGAAGAEGAAGAGAAGAEMELELIHPGGVFEGTVPDASLPLRYRLDVDYGPAGRFEIHDPYAFSPTLTEFDLHLIGEGRHEELYQKLGAHVVEHEGARDQRGRGLQLVGRPPARDAVARLEWHLGAVPARRRARRPLQVRAPDGRRRADVESRSVRV
jgi:1,4-alpha-glucan branching enzyme